MAEATPVGVAASARHLEAAVEYLGRARDELRAAGMHDYAETVAAFLAEIGCDRDTMEALAESRARDLRTLRDLRGDGEDGCEGCGSFAHPDGSCPDEGKE